MKIDAELKTAMEIVREVFDGMKVDSCIIGALVPHFLIALKSDLSSRQTMDVDYVVGLGSWKKFDELKSALEKRGFRRAKRLHRIEYGEHTIIDLLPYGKSIVKEGKLVWPEDDSVMNVSCFERLFEDATDEEIFKGVSWKIAPLPIFVLSKIMAYETRRLGKDISDVVFCLRYYKDDPALEDRYNAMNDNKGLQWEHAGAFVLGSDAKIYLNDNNKDIVKAFLERFISFEVPLIDVILREEGKIDISDDMRRALFELVHWFASGLDFELAIFAHKPY